MDTLRVIMEANAAGLRGIPRLGIAAGLIAFIVPWLAVAMASPLYTTRWGQVALGLWVLGLAAGGVCAVGGDRFRRIGVAIIAGTAGGCFLFVITFATVLLTAGDWD